MVMSALCFCFLFRQCGQCQGRRSDQARISASETQVVASSKYFVKILYREPFSVTVSQQLPVGLPAPLLVKRTSRSFRPKTDAAMADVVTIRGQQARQMFQHLITFHHVISWARSTTCLRRRRSFKMLIEDDNLNTNIRTIVSDELHEKFQFSSSSW